MSYILGGWLLACSCLLLAAAPPGMWVLICLLTLVIVGLTNSEHGQSSGPWLTRSSQFNARKRFAPLFAADECLYCEGQRRLSDDTTTAAAAAVAGVSRLRSKAHRCLCSQPNVTVSTAAGAAQSVAAYSRAGLVSANTLEGIVMSSKLNQDRALVHHSFMSDTQQTLLGVLDGHGDQGECVAEYAMLELPARLQQHPQVYSSPATAMREVVLQVNEALLEHSQVSHSALQLLVRIHSAVTHSELFGLV
jgi:hypothetical protein